MNPRTRERKKWRKDWRRRRRRRREASAPPCRSHQPQQLHLRWKIGSGLKEDQPCMEKDDWKEEHVEKRRA
jgi:hypothetical protein